MVHRKAKLAIASLAAIAAATIVIGQAFSPEGGRELKAHLTLYVGGELLHEGGTVIVASVPIPEAELRAMTGPNPAMEDMNNTARPHLNENDILLGAHVNGRANFVVMYYPEGGTFGFNFSPDTSETTGINLDTERILIGGGGWTDWTTGEDHIWPDVSTIYVSGRSAKRSEGQLLRSVQGKIMNLSPPRTDYLGVLVYKPTSEQLSEGTWGKFFE